MKPREKLSSSGIDNLSDKEILSLILGTGYKDKKVTSVAGEIEKIIKSITKDGGTIGLERLRSVSGIGIAKASKILAGIELGRRLYDQTYRERKKVSNSKEAAILFKDISKKEKEYLEVAFLNARYEVISRETLAIGTLDQVGLHPREILVRALKENSYGIILAHNHPSGDPSPSRSDIEATKNLKKACDLVGVKMIDHLVLTEDEWRSVKI